MRGLNKCYLIGHVGRDPDARTSKDGLAIAKLSLATPRGHKVEGTWVDTPDWHRVTAFGRDAEFLSKFARKGDGLAVECSVRPNKWTDRDGGTRHAVDMIVERVLWLQGKRPALSAVIVPAAEEPTEEEGVLAVEEDGDGDGAVVEASASPLPQPQAQDDIPF